VLTQSGELQVAHDICGLSLTQIMQGQIQAARASFMSAQVRGLVEKRIQAWCAGQSIAID
jgi:hypothetical protein